MMNKIVDFDLQGIRTNKIVVVGIGIEGSQAVNYMKETGVYDVDFLDPNQVTTIKMQNYRSAVFIMYDNDHHNFEAARKLVVLAKRQDILIIGISVFDRSIAEIKKMNYSMKEIDGLKNVCNSFIMIPKLHSQSTDNELIITKDLEINHQIVLLAFRTIFDFSVSLVSFDYSDTYEATKNGGYGFFATGEASGENKMVKALKNALSFNLNIIDYIGDTKNIILHIISKDDVLIAEIEELFNYLQKVINEDTNISWRIILDNTIDDKVRISIVGTGLDKPKIERNSDYKELSIFQ